MAMLVVDHWLPVIEDSILLDQYMHLEIVVYQPPPETTVRNEDAAASNFVFCYYPAL
jgi:hypothetical protein